MYARAVRILQDEASIRAGGERAAREVPIGGDILNSGRTLVRLKEEDRYRNQPSIAAMEPGEGA